MKKTLEMFEYENDKLSTQSDEKARKLKGASEKARNLKDVVVSKDEEKTKGSHGDKQRYLESERGRRRNMAMLYLRWCRACYFGFKMCNSVDLFPAYHVVLNNVYCT